MSTIKLISWNINGFRAAIKKGFWEKVQQLDPDIICLQETKSDIEIMSSEVVKHSDYSMVFNSCSMKKGYSGVATLFKNEYKNKTSDDLFLTEKTVTTNPKILQTDYFISLDIPEFDVEGRLVVTKFKNIEKNFEFTLLNGYFPQGGRGPERIAYKIRFYEAVYKLANEMREKGEKIIICGDLNTTVTDIDLARPKENKNTTGCLPEERDALDLFLKNGYIDSFRYFYPDEAKYTYWDQITRARERNVGWRIDYFLVDESLVPMLKSAEILNDVFGSDHCPVSIELQF